MGSLVGRQHTRALQVHDLEGKEEENRSGAVPDERERHRAFLGAVARCQALKLVAQYKENRRTN